MQNRNNCSELLYPQFGICRRGDEGDIEVWIHDVHNRVPPNAHFLTSAGIAWIEKQPSRIRYLLESPETLT